MWTRAPLREGVALDLAVDLAVAVAVDLAVAVAADLAISGAGGICPVSCKEKRHLEARCRRMRLMMRDHLTAATGHGFCQHQLAFGHLQALRLIRADID